MTTMFNEETQQFAVVDASDSGSAGVGVILCNTTFPVPPFIPIGNSDWSFQQGSHGTIISLSGGRNLAWSLQTTGFGTQITLQPLNPSDLRQQWTFIAHNLV
ncbi:hypothetical protein CPB84DRAFT_1750381 [Gymnopilus junonius]|uniref:Uncharacterized protein n=1 Tax=Gymnopilus junonius TaxID=109634 RepID=A0A9P5TG95_GYMJU|nr:hypothetical protein CPB84DRAFT_1852664 [Gymnopilus junonius]KAF8884575.1 hypothetical protein CPB84DRAFT_1750381 [Gymnopilus junonius]